MGNDMVVFLLTNDGGSYRSVLLFVTPHCAQMEAMEVDFPVQLQGGGVEQPEDVAAAAGPAEEAAAPVLVSDSSSSTEVDEDEDADRDEGRAAARTLLRLPATWAFSQRAAGGAAAAPSGAPGTPMRRRLR